MEALELVSVTHTHSRHAMLAAAADVWAVSLTEHQAMLDEIFADPELLVLVTGNLPRAETRPGYEIQGLGDDGVPQMTQYIQYP